MKKRILFVAVMAMIFIAGGMCGQALADIDRTVSWDPVSTYTDNTPIEAGKVVTYQIYWTTDPNLAPANLRLLQATDGSTVTTGTSMLFNPAANGMVDFQSIYFTGKTILSTGEESALSPGFFWQVAAGSWGIRLMRLPATVLPDSYAVQVLLPTDNATLPQIAGTRILVKTNRGFSNMQSGSSVINLASKLSDIFSVGSSDNAVFVQAEFYNAANSVVARSRIGFHLRGAVCDDILNCRVDAMHSSFFFNPHIGSFLTDLGQTPIPVPDLFGAEFVLRDPATLTPEQRILTYDGQRFAPQDNFEITTHWTNATIP